MKLGINTFFIMKFGFGAGLKFCQTLGVKAVEVAATGPATKRYGDADKLLTDPGKLNRWREAYANHGLELYSFSAHGAPLSPNNTTYLTVRAIPKVKVELIAPVPLMTWL